MKNNLLSSGGVQFDAAKSEQPPDFTDIAYKESSAQLPCRKGNFGLEAAVAVIATAGVTFMLVLLSMNAGPLWRDETNSINIARMPLRELWHNLPFESFPPLYLMLLRGWSFLGFSDSDAGIRFLGLLMGLGFLASLWACARWIKAQAPVLSLALLGSLPAFLFTIEANRAYGLAMCLLPLVFGLIWRVLERPSQPRVISAGIASVLFLHCIYYNAVFLGAMLLGAGLVLVRRRDWRTFGTLILLGVGAGATMMTYLPVFRTSALYMGIAQVPFCDWAHLWNKLNDCLSPTSSSESARSSNFGAFIWIGIAGIGLAVTLARQRHWLRTSPQASPVAPADQQADLTLYSAVAFIFGVTCNLLFLLKLQFSTQVWYYMLMATLCAISVEGILNAGWRAFRPWGATRLAFLVLMFVWGGRAVWREAHTRRSNVDLVAAALEQKSVEGDLVVVQDPWVAITFDRYYHSATRWLTIPPIDSHKVHRNDLISQAMMERDPCAPVVRAASETLQAGHTVWLVGHAAAHSRRLPMPPPLSRSGTVSWFEPYGQFWIQQFNQELVGHARHVRVIPVTAGLPVTTLEDVPLLGFSGYQSTPAP